jgi:trehalose/maltose hydrolase-like predicted phosphorylase
MPDAPRVPRCDADPGWRLVVVGDDPLLRRVHESLLTVAGGRVGTRGTREEDGTGYQPLVMVAGAYTASEGDDMPRPVPGPLWFRHDLSTARLDTEQRVLDLRTGLLHRESSGPRPIRSIRFASLARPGILVQRLEGPAEAVAAGVAPLEPWLERGVVDTTTDGDTTWVRVRDGGAVTAAIWTAVTVDGSRRVVDRIAAFDGHHRDPPSARPLEGRLAAARQAGVDRLLAEHRGRWQDRWRDAAVSIGGDPDLELATRFALCHLIASVADNGEAIVGARGLSGPGYAGHVFWDADVFVLPFLAATHPASARAMLEYRLRRLPAARERAREHGHDGARFPWESAGSGADVTPRSAIGLSGETMAIRTGDLEEHIVADVAWAAWQYTAWSGDRAFLTGAGRPLLIETARYWASRIDLDPDGTAHLRGVIGPDEYHEMVDDNAYTNVMARWNLRRAAELSETARDDDVTANEVKAWRQLAEALVDGYDPATGRYEQFAGYDRLEPLLVSTVATPPVAADVLLGRERMATTQVIKQADVLMLHHLVPDDVAPGSLQPNLDSLPAPHRPRQLAVSCRPRQPPGPRRAPGRRPRPATTRCPARPRRRHRHHSGRAAPGHHGRCLAGPRNRVRRSDANRRRGLPGPPPPDRLVLSRTAPTGPRRPSATVARTRPDRDRVRP